MSSEPLSASARIVTTIEIPDQLVGPLLQLRSAKGVDDSELVRDCVVFALRLILDTQVETGTKTSIIDDLNRALMDVTQIRRAALDNTVAIEKSLADARALLAAIRARPTSRIRS